MNVAQLSPGAPLNLRLAGASLIKRALCLFAVPVENDGDGAGAHAFGKGFPTGRRLGGWNKAGAGAPKAIGHCGCWLFCAIGAIGLGP